jgi:hypothetical protein
MDVNVRTSTQPCRKRSTRHDAVVVVVTRIREEPPTARLMLTWLSATALTCRQTERRPTPAGRAAGPSWLAHPIVVCPPLQVPFVVGRPRD